VHGAPTLRRSPDVRSAPDLGLLNARVLLVGVGGLGSASALYLAAAGVGTLGVVDDDVVDRSNLQRQVLHATDRIGSGKVDSAERSITALNPRVRVLKHRTRLDAANVDEIIDGYDAIVDGVDNFATRYVLNDATVRMRIPVVTAATCDWEGRISVFLPGAGPCYRCLYREPPPAALWAACGSEGTLGALAGVMGTLQAIEVVKLLTGVGEPLVGRILVYDAADATFTELRRERDPRCPVCAPSRSRDHEHTAREIGPPRRHARAAHPVR
jgi:molybdopterin/thiamine biosynthesis adenylyltransferase